MVQILFADVESLGCSLVLIGPVASAENTLTGPPTNDGRMATVKNTIPKPPIHCVNVRQKSMACGRCSTSSSIVAPVVVKPDIVSKYALVKPGMYPPIRYGSDPNRLNTTHVSVTTIKESRRLMLFEALRPWYLSIYAVICTIRIDTVNDSMSSSP